MPLLPRYASLLRIGEGPQGDPVTPGYVRWRQAWDLWTLVFLLRREKLLGGRTGATSWTRLRSGRVRHKQKKSILCLMLSGLLRIMVRLDCRYVMSSVLVFPLFYDLLSPTIFFTIYCLKCYNCPRSHSTIAWQLIASRVCNLTCVQAKHVVDHGHQISTFYAAQSTVYYVSLYTRTLYCRPCWNLRVTTGYELANDRHL